MQIASISGAFGIFKATTKSFLYNLSQNGNVSGVREVLDPISDELRYATAISVSSLGTASTLPGTAINYAVNAQSRQIYTITGNPTNTNTLVIAYDGVVQRSKAINNMQSITFTRDTTYTQKLTIQRQVK